MLTCISEPGAELIPEHSKLLAALALAVVRDLGAETVVVDADNNIQLGWRMARVGDLALLEKPADAQSPKHIDVYQVASSKVFKLDSERALFTLRYQHNGIPPDFELLLYGNTQQWFGATAISLFGELERRKPSLFDSLRVN